MYCIVKSASISCNAPASPTTLKHPHSNRCEHNNHQATRFGNSVSGIGVHSNRPELKESFRERFGVLSYEGCTVQRTATSTVARFPTGAMGSTFYLGRKKRDTHYPPQKSMLSTIACPWNWSEQLLLTTNEATTRF